MAREYNGLLDSPCCQGGEFGCFSCHAMHQSDPDVLGTGLQTRRLLFTLAHAHGTLLGVLNILFGLTVGPQLGGRAFQFASRLLLAGTVFLPAGFFLGGVYIYDGDPGLASRSCQSVRPRC